ncbi:hypothetical protein [Streptomyces sp. MMBL 11-1]|uniref:hypothetical protein n=1 Tax=Streptomyces sp. MMBL 11-1 TaxID=3026420 RepID=UPI00235E6AB3|nr:hypothetical protein [Streptomyces sp. MMBL 11-1]
MRSAPAEWRSRPSEPQEVALPGFGVLTIQMSVLEHGQSRYEILGRHVRGTVVVVPSTPNGGPVIPTAVRVRFGDAEGSASWSAPCSDEPIVHGVRIHGYTDVINPRTVSRRDHFLTSDAVARSDGGRTRRIPDGARALTEAVVVAVVKHWHRRDDRALLVRAAARSRAADQVRYEDRQIARLQAELQTVRDDRAAARRCIRQVVGLVRRRQPDVQPPVTGAARVPFLGPDGVPMGILTVREKEVGVLPGRVVYEVEGGRVRGTFTVGPDLYDYSQAIPQGIYISYGRPMSGTSPRACADEPSVNGVRLSGGWAHGRRSDDITPTSPDHLPAQVRLGPTTSASAPAATSQRASAVLRALALHYLSRPDGGALRIAAGKQRAGATAAAARERLGRLRKRDSLLTSRLRRHRARRQEFLGLLTGPSPALAVEPTRRRLPLNLAA